MKYDRLWTTGSNDQILFCNVIDILKKVYSKGSKIFIGTDSFISKKKVTFASAICVHDDDIPARYFFIRDNENLNKFSNLVSRITEETYRSVQIAEHLMEQHGFSPEEIELHLDVSPFNLNNGTSKISEMLKGFVKGYGFGCKIKPNAWASQSVADRHSK
jgi:predicted RNase H-related nuclease YkuK (DUF458 family)